MKLSFGSDCMKHKGAHLLVQEVVGARALAKLRCGKNALIEEFRQTIQLFWQHGLVI